VVGKCEDNERGDGGIATTCIAGEVTGGAWGGDAQVGAVTG
jgi:hypothetical protein